MQFASMFELQVSLGAVVAAFLAFGVKQLLADYVLQTDWMAKGKQQAEAWIAPLAAHCLTHAAGTLLIALAFNPALWWLAIVDFWVHAAIDLSKARISRAATLTPATPVFWWLFGADQQLHALTHLALAVALISA